MTDKVSAVRALFQGGRYLSSRALIQIRVELVQELIGPLADQRILDLGCGDGSLSLQYAVNNEITLVDISSTMLDSARRNIPRDRLEHVRLENMAVEDFATDVGYDLVLCVGLLAHVRSVESTVKHVASLLRPGGRCIFQITDSDRWMGRALGDYFALRMSIHDRVGYKLNRLGHRELERFASAHGLRQLQERRTWSILPGMRVLPEATLLRYLRTTSKSDTLQRFAPEALLLFGQSEDTDQTRQTTGV